MFQYVMKINNYRTYTIGNFSTLVCRIEISQILFCLMLTFKLATVFTLDQLRRLMTSVKMLVYSMESLVCLMIFKVINLFIDNKMCCVRIVVFHCFIFFIFVFLTLRIVSSVSVLFCQQIIY